MHASCIDRNLSTKVHVGVDGFHQYFFIGDPLENPAMLYCNIKRTKLYSTLAFVVCGYNRTKTLEHSTANLPLYVTQRIGYIDFLGFRPT